MPEPASDVEAALEEEDVRMLPGGPDNNPPDALAEPAAGHLGAADDEREYDDRPDEYDSSDPEFQARYMRPGGPGRELLGRPPYRPRQAPESYLWSRRYQGGTGYSKAPARGRSNVAAAARAVVARQADNGGSR